ncbi:MAG: thioesterase family protein [Schwartzia sp.]|nr:thioesterase family protein [Schwartzia sp. (in: firmicutes)]
MNLSEKITPGLTREALMTTEVKDTAQIIGSGTMPVLATPAMAALMERAASELAETLLPEGWTSVGTELHIHHTAATPVGLPVRAIAIVTAVEGRKITFELKAYDTIGEIGSGTHQRAIVEADRFLGKAQARRDKK